jgi:RNA recognition motif-containing protein
MSPRNSSLGQAGWSIDERRRSAAGLDGIRDMGNRLYVGNLSYQCSNDELRDAFAAFGEVADVHVVTDRESGQSRGFGFVTMGTPDEAQKAMTGLDGSMLDGRALRVNEAEERQDRGGGGGGGGGGRGGGGGGGRGGGGGGGGRPRR